MPHGFVQDGLPSSCDLRISCVYCSYTKQVLDETMRHRANGISLRLADSDMEIGGYHVPAQVGPTYTHRI